MIIENALIKGKIKSVIIENGKIADITDKKLKGDIDAKGNLLIPGFIDIHTHGMKGVDTMDGNFKPLCKYYADCGVTSFLPTTMTMPYEDLIRVTKSKTDFSGAQILGFHFEGPYIAKSRKGAQDERNIKIPSYKEFSRFSNVKLITVAPEVQNALEFIKKVSSECKVALGHTDCDYATALKAIKNGADCLTHTFNAMPPLLHRASGPIGAAVEKGAYAQIICDGFHIEKATVLSAYKMFSKKRMILISDSIRPAKSKDGVYDCGGLKVTLKGREARLSDGTIAGSCSTLTDCVKKAVEFGIPFYDAVEMASSTPAEFLGIKKGKIKKGYDADLLITDEKLNIKTVIIGGKIYK